jgi:hypothetical protein
MIFQGEDSVLLVRAFISRTGRNGWLNEFRENPIPVYGFSSCGSGIIFLPLQQKSEVEPI